MLKKTFLIFILLFGLTLHAQESTPRFVKLTKSELTEVEKYFNWNQEEVLIINFVLPQKFSDDDSYKNLIETHSLWLKYYKSVDLKNTVNKFVYSDCILPSQIAESDLILNDKNKLVRNIFFAKEKNCSGVILVNKKGEFKIKSWEYSAKDIERYLAELRN